jgi:hypothetical protein
MSPPTFGFSLTVGATGMLARALDFVAEQSEHTVVVARHASRALANRPRPRASALDVDWRQTQACLTAIDHARGAAAIDLALLWIHETGAELLQALLDRVRTTDCLVIHVLSSAAPDPTAFRDALDRTSARCRYRAVRLGAMRTLTGGSRWLTNDEISDGVIEAIRKDKDVTIGQLPT